MVHGMDWGNSVVQWLASDEGWRVLSGAIIPATAIIVAGVIAAIIGRGSTKRLIALHGRDALAAALAAFLLAGRRAAAWNTLGDIERSQLDHLIAETETRIRLLPLTGSGLAATWATHELAAMKRDSAGFQFQAQQTLADYRDRLVMWSKKPRSAKKLFGADLERWKFEVDDEVRADVVDAAPSETAVASWESLSGSADRLSLTPEPPSSVAAASGTMPLVMAEPMAASTVRARVVPDSAD